MLTAVEPHVLVILVVLILLGAMVNGLVGMGFALLAVNIIAFALGSRDAVIVASILTPVTSGIQLYANRSVAHTWIRLRTLLLGALVGTAAGALLLVVMPIWLISIALGLFTLQFVWDSLHRDRPQMAAGRERRLAPFAGFVSGMTNGSLGASGPVVGSFLLAIGLRGKEFIFAISLVFVFQGVIRDSVFLVNGQYTGPFLLTSLALLVPALVGQQFGLRLRGRLDAKMFQRILLTVLGISALNLLIKGVSGGISAAQAAGLLG